MEITNPNGSIVRFTSVNAKAVTADNVQYTGSIDNLSPFLEELTLRGSHTGDVRNLSSRLTVLSIVGSPNVTITEGPLPRWSDCVIMLQNAWTTTEVDTFLNSWRNTCATGTVVRAINLAGTSSNANAPRSSASDDAVTDMAANHNKTFTFN